MVFVVLICGILSGSFNNDQSKIVSITEELAEVLSWCVPLNLSGEPLWKSTLLVTRVGHRELSIVWNWDSVFSFFKIPVLSFDTRRRIRQKSWNVCGGALKSGYTFSNKTTTWLSAIPI